MDICRICLISDAPKNICEIQTIKRKKKNLVDIISFCLNIQVTEDSKVSKNLCIKCYTKLLNFHNFKELALKNDAYLKCLANGVDVKRENVKDEVKTEEIVNNNNVTVDSLNTRECIVLVDRTAVKLEPKTKDDDDDDPDYIPDEADFGSDNEFLSVIKKIKYEYMPENAKEGEAIQIDTTTKKRKRKLKSERIAEVCDICGKAVKDMKTHKLFHNKPLSDRKNYKCDLCDKTYSSHTARYRHKRVKHLGMKKICPICNKAVSNLRYHKMMIHDYETMPFQCASCSHRFITASKLEEHMTIHTKDKPFECSVCGQKFRLKVVMEQHRRNIHENERTHLCQFCSKSFFKKYHLLVHLRMHTNERPYECPECGRRFGSCTTLKNHRLTHTDLKSFECHYCDAKFQRRSYLHVHLRTHTKEKRHGCKYCGLMFGRSDHRRRHEYTAHEKHTLAAPAPAPAQVGC